MNFYCSLFKLEALSFRAFLFANCSFIQLNFKPIVALNQIRFLNLNY